MLPMPFPRGVRSTLLLVLLAVTAACKEDQGSSAVGVAVKELSFSGNRAVTTDQLRQVLSTQASSKIPWGDKQYFTRAEFEADLKRIVAFYKDRGFPTAKVSSFDAQLSDDQKSVRLKVVIDEGEPLRVQQIVMNGLDALPPEHRGDLDKRFPLKVGAPLDRALMQSSREAIVDELKDHGYPNPDVTYVESSGASDLQRVDHLHREARQRGLRRQHPDPGNVERQPENCRAAADVPAGSALPAEQAAREPAPSLLDGALQLRQHRSVESGHPPGGAGRECAPSGLRRA